MYRMITTVGELKNIVKYLPDDMLLISFYPGEGYVNKRFVDIGFMKPEKDFYGHVEYERSDEGQECLIFG